MHIAGSLVEFLKGKCNFQGKGAGGLLSAPPPECMPNICLIPVVSKYIFKEFTGTGFNLQNQVLQLILELFRAIAFISCHSTIPAQTSKH